MSIENELKRIADALESLEVILNKGPVPVPDPILPQGEAVTTQSGPADKILVIEQIKDLPGLAAFAQKCLDAAELKGKTNELVTFVREKVTTKFSPAEPKLMKIPADKAQAAAKMIYDWCFNQGIMIN